MIKKLLKNQQEKNNNIEHGVSILGKIEGTKLKVHNILNLKAGNSDSVTFKPDDYEKSVEEAQKSGLEMLGYGHTHPENGGDTPSSQDIFSATRSQVSMLLKVNEDGSGRIEFFDGEKRNIGFTGIDAGKNGKISDVEKSFNGEYDERNHRASDDYGKKMVA